MIMLTAEEKKRYTAYDYSLLEEGAPFQLINYDLIMSPSPVLLHQLLLIKLIRLVSDFLEASNNEGILAVAPMDVKFDDGNILQPDIFYITAERKEEVVKDRIEGAPDLIIEILSPSNAYYDLRQKKDIYEKYGVKEYIIIDPIQQNADLYTLKHGFYNLQQKASGAEILQSQLLPGLNFDMKRIFI